MSIEEIENSFTSVGWNLDGSFSEYLVIGYTDDGISILAGKEAWEADEPAFELIDHEGNSPTWFRKYRLPGRPTKCSESTASHAGSGSTSPKTLCLLL